MYVANLSVRAVLPESVIQPIDSCIRISEKIFHYLGFMNTRQSMTDQLKQSIQGDVLEDDYSLGMYSTDASFYQIRPLAVILPKNESDVKKAVEIARNNKIKILPRGGGTSLAGQTVGEALVIDFSKYMNRVLEFNAIGKMGEGAAGCCAG